MSMNLKEEYHYVVNRGEDLMVIDFSGDVSLAEKLVRHRACATEWMVARNAEHQRATTDRGEESTPTVESWKKSQEAENVAVGRKKRQQSGNRLEVAAAATGGRCWEGKERLAEDQIRSRSSREVGRAASAARVLQSATRGCHEWRRPEDILRAEEK
ncbi:hypothetical protein B296_00024407 [Ensete ventricosum]|uniref:Uncharacterized protein n=1 Tax=Ensete ventricosum TaxID=4639 RepID=A0A427AJJ2_ENSVE|nr:hypothetical protein B296_00024407 [Ensete ventricosum]